MTTFEEHVSFASQPLPFRNHRSVEVVFTGRGEVAVLPCDEVPLRAKEVRVRTLLSGISHGTEMNMLLGTAPGFRRQWDKPLRVFRDLEPHKGYPVRPGYETVGVVVETGSEADGVTEGDLVWIDRPHRSEHVVGVEECRAGLLPPGMTAGQGIFSALTRVALGAVHDAQVKLGDRVAVVGLGAIGLIALQLLVRHGASEVFGIDRAPARLALAAQFGATPILATSGDSAAVEVKCRTGGGVDAAIDASGSAAGLHTAIAMCRMAGRAVAVSSYQGDAAGLRLGEEFHRNRITLISSMTVNGAPHRDHPGWDLDRLNRTARDLLASRAIDVEPMLTHVFPVSDAAAAYRVAAQPAECIKVAFRYDG